MYKKAELALPSPSDFELPFGGNLSLLNRWVKMAQIIPWSEFESEYAANFPERKGCTSQIMEDGIGGINYQRKTGKRAIAQQSNKSVKTLIYNTLSVNQATVMNYHLTHLY